MNRKKISVLSFQGMVDGGDNQGDVYKSKMSSLLTPPKVEYAEINIYTNIYNHINHRLINDYGPLIFSDDINSNW